MEEVFLIVKARVMMDKMGMMEEEDHPLKAWKKARLSQWRSGRGWVTRSSRMLTLAVRRVRSEG